MKTFENTYKIGVDAGSTTIKLIVLNTTDEIIYKSYRRHKANIQATFLEELALIKKFIGKVKVQICITGSAGIGLAERLGTNFIQEVVASVELVQKRFANTKTLFDLGGEDAKMVFFENNRHPDIRMNGSCAGGTGAFIDQMASLMNIPVEELGCRADEHENIYPIASRCGVFAKTDIQNLISRNVPVPDIAASTLHAVALQSITSLARAREIIAPVLCVGGPLTFIPALRKAFCKQLALKPDDLTVPENGEFFPAWGTALHINNDFPFYDINQLMLSLSSKKGVKTNTLPALFADEDAYRTWKKNRNIKALSFKEIGQGVQADCFLGIDSGSTTTKIVITDTELNIVYRYYASNEGNSLNKVVEGLEAFYANARELGATVNILASAVTGYGEDLIKSALDIDHGIVETMAHLSGAQFVDPEVSFVLDIGGQDIKSIFTEKGVISNIELNEACSSGCGSFLQSFASTMNIGMNEFSTMACLAKHPSDLGSRCTVFMNSKVKQSLRENAGSDDISAGLAYSVVKNCLFKVLKISNLNKLGDHIVVQGGTFRNDAIYRSMELISGKTVSSTDHPELMGAFGAALYAYRQWEKGAKTGSFAGEAALATAQPISVSELRCKGCTNTCSIVRFKFANGNSSYAGNKCEKIFHNTARHAENGRNAFDEKNKILFQPVHVEKPIKSTVGIPRVLNMFENYPFWSALFSHCGHQVILSDESTFKLYQSGVGSIMSDNICFPAKLVHGHILNLIEKKVDRIFYPIVPKDVKEFSRSNNSFNCPVVSGYPDVIKSSIDPEGKFQVPFDTPVIGFNDDKVLKKACWKYFKSIGTPKSLFDEAFAKALLARETVKRQLIGFQQDCLQEAISQARPLFVIAGRPYHADPLVHQKAGQILADLGAIVLTDDVFRDEPEEGYKNLNIVTQWSYPNRVVQSALKIAALPQNVQMIQMNSFGCGPDSFIMDEASEILAKSGKNLTIIRVDEIASPGSVRLRLRSLVESLKNMVPADVYDGGFQGYKGVYTKSDRKKTIIVPWLADFLSPFVPAFGNLAGYKLVNLPKPDAESAELGLKYGHNEVCYPSTLVLGDIIKCLKSGRYDLDNLVVAITQTGGQCRATNYIAQIKSGIERAGFDDIPVLALAAGDTFQNDQKAFNPPWTRLANIGMYAVLYGDAIQQMFAAVSVREKQKGSARQLFDFYIDMGVNAVSANDHRTLLRFLGQAVADFNNLPVYEKEFAKIGLIGEIYVKYNSFAQAHISEWLREREMEVMTPPIVDFVMQYFVNSEVNSHPLKMCEGVDY